MPWFAGMIQALPPPNKVGKDAKTRLQEWVQGRGKPLPQYAVLEEGGEDHARVFRASCTLAEPALRTEGEGGSRRAAEQQAAEAAMRIIEA
jgi:ribonuclease-3